MTDPSTIEITGALRQDRLSAIERIAIADRYIKELESAIKEARRVVIEIKSSSLGNQDATPVVGLLEKTDEELGEYRAVGTITVVKEQVSPYNDQDITIKMGAGFDTKPEAATKHQVYLGQGIDGKEWYGEWNDNHTESTETLRTMIERDVVKNPNLNATKLAQVCAQIEAIIASINESIVFISKAGQNKVLNPPEEIPY